MKCGLLTTILHPHYFCCAPSDGKPRSIPYPVTCHLEFRIKIVITTLNSNNDYNITRFGEISVFYRKMFEALLDIFE